MLCGEINLKYRHGLSHHNSSNLTFVESFINLHIISPTLSNPGSRLWLAHRVSCPEACGITPDQGLTPWSLHWQADSQPQDYQGSPCDDTCYPLWDPEGDLLLRFTQLGAWAAEGWGRGALDRRGVRSSGAQGRP